MVSAHAPAPDPAVATLSPDNKYPRRRLPARRNAHHPPTNWFMGTYPRGTLNTTGPHCEWVEEPRQPPGIVSRGLVFRFRGRQGLRRAREGS